MSKRTPTATYSSALARELSSIPRPLRRQFGIPDMAILILDVFVEVVRVLLEPSGDKPIEERLESAMLRAEREYERAFPDGFPEAKLKALERWARIVNGNPKSVGTPSIQRRIERSVRLFKGGKMFWRRILGAAHYDRLERALREDGAVILLAARRFGRYVMPIALAMDDLASILPEGKRSTLKGVPVGDKTFLDVIHSLDSMIDDVVDKRDIPFDNLPVRPDEERAFEVNMDALLGTLRASLESETRERTSELSDVLLRKLQGFDDALSGSADGVSQAANSLVEYIDRLLRGSFTREEVLAWVREHRPDEADDLTYTDAGGVEHPTKLAQALCFAHAGQPPAGQDEWNRVAAVGLVEVRRQAEKIKHSDRATLEEQELLARLMNATRGYFMFSVRLSWALLDRSRFDELRGRFGKAA